MVVDTSASEAAPSAEHAPTPKQPAIAADASATRSAGDADVSMVDSGVGEQSPPPPAATATVVAETLRQLQEGPPGASRINDS